VYSALEWAGARADVVGCSIGPGIVGTASLHGHGGMAAADAANAASALGASPVLALRLSTAERRARHRGLSHHVEGILSVSGPSVRLAWPDGCPIGDSVSEGADTVDVSGWREACAGLPLSHMGRGPDDDPWFFAAAFAAGRLARTLVR